MRLRVYSAVHSLVPLIVLGTLSAAIAAQTSTTEQEDKYQWLEDVNGKRSMDWVNAHNAASAKILEADPRFAKLRAEALKIAEAPDRLPAPDFENNEIYNTWNDAAHIRGILRRTTLTDYLTRSPQWHTVLDFDALGKAEHQSWVHSGLVSLYPGGGLSLVGLSQGGEDAHTYREFDLKSGQFVKGGFVIPKAKSSADWLDKNHLLVTSEWGPGTLTDSGYPFIVKVWTRGTPLANAKEIFRGKKEDVSVGSETLHDGQGRTVTIIERRPSFFETEDYLWSVGKAIKIDLPKKCRVAGLVDNRMIVTIEQDWKTFSKGSVLSINLPALKRDAGHLNPTVVFAPTSSEFPQEMDVTQHKLILTTLENVQGRAYVVSLGSHGKWGRKRLPLPNNLSVSIAAASQDSDKFFLDVTGMITPPSLWLGDAATGSLEMSKSRKPQFDASNLKVEQLWVKSKDGTRVPYFIVHRKNMKLDGSNPTLLSAYGGFQVSSTPYYSGTIGKLWLDRGGVYVLANIRGGGEFGPAWHEAGLKTHRQRIYDDFAAVGADLVARHITSPKHLGIEGGSNGGLLVGVEMTQHPEMWNAVVIEVPLLDMLRFEHIAAGASWVGEYGSVSVPAERKFLASISPYNQLKPQAQYPEPLIFTTTKDDRVGPVHARKFAARMEEFGKPFFYDEIVEGGHSGGADLKQQAKTQATTFTYLMRKLMD